MITTLIFVAFLQERFQVKLLTPIYTKAIIGIGLSIATLLAFISEGLILIIASGLTGVFSALMSLQWIYAFRRLGLKVSIEIFPSLLATSTCICVVVIWTPSILATGIITMLPFFSEVLFHISRKNPIAVYSLESMPPRIASYALIFLFTAICAFAIGFFDADSSYAPLFHSSVLVLTFIFVGIFIVHNDRGAIFQKFIVPFVFIFALLMPFLSSGDDTAGYWIIGINNLNLEILIFIAATGVSEILFLDPLRAFAIVRITFTAVGILSSFITNSIDNLLSNQILSVQVSFVLIGIAELSLVIIVLVLLRYLRVSESERFRQEAEANITEEATSAANKTTEYKDKCSLIAKQFSLTERELEVMIFLGQGFTSSRIQKELFIAPGTVSYHSHNIYMKLGIHSKQDLIDMINSFEER